MNGVNGGAFPESTDECLNTILNALSASDRENPDTCNPPGPLQINDFTPAFRPTVRKLVVLITDATPGGFCDSMHTDHAHEYALQARANCVKINAIHVALMSGVWDSPTDTVMVDYYQTSCGWHSQIPHDGGDVTRAVLKMFYEDGFCACP